MGTITNIQNLKEYLGPAAQGKNLNDVLLTRLLAAATEWIERYCNRLFDYTVYTEFYNGTGSDRLTLRNYPVDFAAGFTILEDGAALLAGTDPTANPEPDVLVYEQTGILVRPFGEFLRLPRFYKITYKAGFATMPPVVVQAVLDLASLMFRERDRIGLDVKNTGQQQVTFRRKLPDYITEGLNTYRKLGVGIMR